MSAVAERPIWLDDETPAADLHRLLGTVRDASFSSTSDTITLHYQDGRTVTIKLHQCTSHYCDRTAMVLA